MRRFLAGSLVTIMALGVVPSVFARQGTISGRASEARGTHTDYEVQLVDARTNQVADRVPLSDRREFAFMGIAPERQYLVHLYNLRETRIVCTEGPYTVLAPNRLSYTNVNISCRKPVALFWLLGGAGVVTTAVVAAQSASQ
ncbi:MAG: hypothetical protein ACT4QD_26990 [Acidobacteriota bacterium]